VPKADSSQHVLVLGAGNFGTCLGQHLAENGHRVTIWSIDDGVAEAINKTRKNPKFFNQIILSERLQATNKISRELLETCDAMVIAIPTQALREVLGGMKDMLNKDMTIICAAKGIEVETLKLPLEIITDVLGRKIGRRASLLSGPSFAEEIMVKLPTAVAVASLDEAACLSAQKLFHADEFRAYTSDDPIGIGVAGALKNVIAIAAGATAGLGFQKNTQAAVLTRGLAEITRVGVALGANPLTFTGLAGVGDLFLTCTSEKSRNYRVGFRLGKGESLKDVLATMGSVAEGVYTAKAARALALKLGVETPIIDQVYGVLYHDKPIKEAVRSLLSREARPELDLPVRRP